MNIYTVSNSGTVECDGCRLPVLACRARVDRVDRDGNGRSYHDQCHTEWIRKFDDPDVAVGATRARLTALRAQVQLGIADTDTLRTVLLALLDEVLR